jgi:hypothetical protein
MSAYASSKKPRSREEHGAGVSFPHRHQNGQSTPRMHLTPGLEQYNAFVKPRMRSLEHDHMHRENVTADREFTQRYKRKVPDVTEILCHALDRIGIGGGNEEGLCEAESIATAIIQEKHDTEKLQLLKILERDLAESAKVYEAALAKRNFMLYAAENRRRYPTETYVKGVGRWDD